MTKVNQQTMKNQYDGQYDTFCRKNHDYGNSFEESLDQFGIVASIVRMSDKMKRLESLTDESKTQQVGSESLLDTLEDLSNYAAMTACWLKGVRAEDSENTIYGDNKPVVTYVGDRKVELEGPELTDAVKDVITMLKGVFKIYCKMEEFKADGEDRSELDHIENRLRSMINDGSISKEIMLQLINTHLLLNKDVLIFQLFKIGELKAQKELNELVESIYTCRDKNLSLEESINNTQKHLELYDSLARMILNEQIEFDYISKSVNSTDILTREEKVQILESIVSAAYRIDSENTHWSDRNAEFINKKFHIPEKVVEDLKEPGHIPEIPKKEEPKSLQEELEELFVKQNEHIKVLLTSGATKDDIKPLAILDYKSKTSEAVNGYDLMVALDCLIPNLTKEGLEHFISVAENVLKMKDFDHDKRP